MNQFFKKVGEICNLPEEHPVLKILESCGFDSYDAIVSLSSANFEEIRTYCDKNNIDYKPGFSFTLLGVGKKVKAAGETIFSRSENNDFQNIQLMNNFPLLLSLMHQVGKRLFSPIIQKFSMYMRLVLGPVYYAFLALNLPILQSKTVQANIGKEEIMVEGEIMVSNN